MSSEDPYIFVPSYGAPCPGSDPSTWCSGLDMEKDSEVLVHTWRRGTCFCQGCAFLKREICSPEAKAVEVVQRWRGGWGYLLLYGMVPGDDSIRSSAGQPGPQGRELMREALSLTEARDVFVPLSDHTFGHGRLCGSAFDPDLARLWMYLCHDGHTLCHRGPKWTPYPRDLLLIDVTRWRITAVQERDTPSYFALSYVWGGVSQPQLSTSNLACWQADGALRTLHMPRTIRNAIRFTESARVRYLWVDALCIVHDDRVQRHDQINQMFRIYSHADLTLVAADGDDCDSGLSRLNKEAGQGRERVHTLGSVKLCRTPEQPGAILQESKWRTRGWTFQEELCSSRLLVFLPDLVFYSCSEALWREDVCLETKRHAPPPGSGGELKSIHLRIQDNVSSSQAVEVFRDLVMQYCARSLSRPGDVENAFAGIAGILEPIVGPLYHGIPERYFRPVITGCWYWGAALSRRLGFPSWSWMGWLYTSDVAETGIKPLDPEFDHGFFLHFYKLSDGSCKPLFIEESKLHEHFAPNTEQVEHKYGKIQDLAATGHLDLIAFFTSFALLQIRPCARRPVFELKDTCEYQVLHPSTGSAMTTILLKNDFLSANGRIHAFIVVGHSLKSRSFRLMLISISNFLSYRVNVTVPGRTVKEQDWWDSSPTRRLIVMG